MKRTLFISLIAFSIIATGIWQFYNNRNPQNPPALRLSQTLGDNDQQFAQAIKPREFQFPQDHGPHSKYKTEWWYITGNITSSNGKAFGYQVTFFRVAMTASKPTVDSAWASNQFFMADAAISDISQHRFYSKERFARDALGLSGATTKPEIKVWLEDWVLQGDKQRLFPLLLNVKDKIFSLSLTLSSQKPVILQGERGLSQKGPKPGNASYYYSYTRLNTTGKIRIGKHEFTTTGNSWLDREWSTSMLPKGVAGWDWFSIQLNNNTELMVYRLRKPNGEVTEFSKASLVLADGKKIMFIHDQFSATPTHWWHSPQSGIRYPVAWRLTIPNQHIFLQIKAAIPNQELNHSVRYWEGATIIHGTYQQRSVKGKGYLELTGYDSK